MLITVRCVHVVTIGRPTLPVHGMGYTFLLKGEKLGVNSQILFYKVRKPNEKFFDLHKIHLK